MTATHQAPAKLRHVLIALVLLATGVTGWSGSATAQSPVAQEPIKVVKIFERLCPANVDPAAGTWQQARTSCPDVVEGLVFTLTSRDPSYAISQPVNALGETEWREVPFGQAYTISHPDSVEYGPAWVTCRFDMNRDPSIPGTERIFQAPDNVIDIGGSEPVLATYGEVECYWFDRPSTAGVQAEPDADASSIDTTSDANTTTAGVQADVDASPAASPETSAITPPDTGDANTTNAGLLGDPDAGARVDIQAFACPFHYNYRSPAVPACNNTPLYPVPFSVNGVTQNTTAGGFAEFRGVPYGSVTITQDAFENYDAARVYCHTQPATDAHGPVDPAHEIPFTANADDSFSVTLTVNPGEIVDCRWFAAAITEDYASTVLLHKYVCPDGVATSGSLADLQAACTPGQSGAYFTIESALLQGGRTDSSGYRPFLNIASGPFTVTSTQPLGFVTKRVFCVQYHASDWDHITESYVDTPISGLNSISGSIQPQWEIDCQWFVQKGVDHGYLDVPVRSCPLNFNPSATTPRNTFAQQCTVPIDGVPFSISSVFGYDFALDSPSVAGAAFFQTAVPAAPLTINGAEPNTHRYLRAFCGSAPYVGIGAIPSTWTSFTSLQTAWDVKAGDQVVCEYYYKPLAIAADISASPASETPDMAASPYPETDEDTTESSSTTSDAPATSAAPIETQVDTPDPAAAPTAQSSGTTTSPEPGDTATLLLNLHTCPTGYDVYAAQADPALDCAPASGPPSVTVNDAASQISADGTAGWTELPAGVAQIDAAPGAFLGACSSDLRAIPADAVVPYVFAGPSGTVGVSLIAGETLTCDWYSALDAASGSVTVTLFSCPGPTVIEAQCDPAPGPASVQFAPVGEADAAFTLEIDASGTGQASATGAYQILSFPDGTCSIESDAFDATGALVIDPGATVEVRMYLCAQSS